MKLLLNTSLLVVLMLTAVVLLLADLSASKDTHWERFEKLKTYARETSEPSLCASAFHCCYGDGKCGHCRGKGKINQYVGPEVEAYSEEELKRKTKGMYKEVTCEYCGGTGTCAICGGKGATGES